MSSKVVDLTLDTPSPHRKYNPSENAKAAKARNAISSAQQTRLPPLRDIPNNAQAPRSRNPDRQSLRRITKALSNAIDSMDVAELRELVKKDCETNERMRHPLERANLVRGRNIDRYHHDTESEDDKESEIDSELESEVEPEDSDEEEIERERKVYPIAIGDDEYISRYTICENCKQRFDVTMNSYRDCYWHEGKTSLLTTCERSIDTSIGMEMLDYDADIWADHDERCHGPMDSFIDDPDYDEGFLWDFCDAEGYNEGCKFTKHKAAVNQVVEAPTLYAGGFKRKADD